MNFDIGSFLQKEIQKKQAEINNSNHTGDEVKVDTSTATNKSSKQESIIEGKPTEYKDELTLINAETRIASLEKIERLETRSKRVKEIIENESKDSDCNISIEDILDGSCSDLPTLARKSNIYIHKLLTEWMDSEYDPELLLETKKNIFPLLVTLRKYDMNSKMDENMLLSITTILYHLQQPAEINQSLQSYMKLSIGNVAWPIGVTQIGIHQRSAHSRLNDRTNVANIMIDERTRLWITSLKRLITFREWQMKN
ncbi:hypothetical protein TPHA_0K01440 [Tetrapisispora phaffii CBS 4417]|uniref:Pre-mRNA-splicing factor 18 n=1 Tax=Tetrapisispora phaffii (strain ATCC 24235 / CBS 4417 / NBRC 1672 / NRRL Y-8282 / UCD 70-5) TaxID=1071381 RepID=G8BZE9_TETPH|nr:hypothetical protein TPHA_0K01440 [Tetrapisispora phaffii CBS 4417]CCE65277.1 hypothetical protein TPHA_0K01440 [Tetrapisispora phaffii CBS 4417]